MNNLQWCLCAGLKCSSGILENKRKNHTPASDLGLVSAEALGKTANISEIMSPGQGTDFEGRAHFKSYLCYFRTVWPEQVAYPLSFSSFISETELKSWPVWGSGEVMDTKRTAQGKACGRWWINDSYYYSTGNSIILHKITGIFFFYYIKFLTKKLEGPQSNDQNTTPPSHGRNNATSPRGKLQYMYLDVIILSIREWQLSLKMNPKLK